MFKKLLQFKTFLIVCLLAMVGTSNVWGQTTKEFSFAFTTIGSTGWSSSYSSHTYEYPEGTVYFTEANKQTSTITDVPVTKGKPVAFVMKEGFTISDVTFSCKQWGSKAQTITLHYSTDGGKNYTSTGVTSTNFTIAKNDLPTGTNAVKITFSTSNQVGVSSVKLTYTSSTSASLNENDLTLNATEKNFDLKDEANRTFQLTNSGNADGALSYESDNTAVATVDESGLITAVGEGTATITVTQAESQTYNGGNAECIVTVTDSRYSQCTISNLTFTEECNGSGTADDGAEWTVASDGSESTFDNDRGIHYGTGKVEVQYIELSTSDINGTIKKIVVNASAASDVTATAGVNVGGSAFGGDPQALSTTATDYTFTGSAEGEIIVTVTKPSSAVKAIYVKSVKVYYEPSTDPSITVDNATVDVTAAGAEGTITVTYENIDDIVAEVAFYEANGTTEATYDWIEAEINQDNNVEYTVAANTTTESRIAYLKVYALDDDDNDVYSELITINQAAYVAPALTQINLTKTLVFSIDDNSHLSGTYADNNTKTNLYGKWEGDESATEFEGFKFNQISKQSSFQFKASAGSITFPPIISTYGFDVTYEATQNDVTVFIDDGAGSSTSSTNAKLMLKRTTTGAARITSITLTPKAAPATDVTVNVGTTKYATLYSDANLVVPEGITVYAVGVNDNANALVVTEVAVEEFTTIEGGQGYMLKADAAGNYTFTATSNDADMVDVTGNLLKGTMTETTITVKNGHQLYKLAYGENGIGFYLDSNEGTTLKNGANKAYLDVPTTLSIRGFALSDAITAIEAIEMKNSVAEGLYDLQGRRVHDVQKGIYVVNGKKLFVK